MEYNVRRKGTPVTKTLHIRGGKPLSGRVRIAGAKNAASKMMIASLLTDEEVVIDNCPQIEEIAITAEICAAVGAHVIREGSRTTLRTEHIHATKVTGMTGKNRISVLALAPLLHRAGKAEVPVVGGDAIGPRPVNYHLQVLQQMGVDD